MRIAFIILLLLSGLPQVQSGGFNSRSLGSLIVDSSNSLIVGNITLKSPISNRQSQTAYQSRPQVIEKVKSRRWTTGNKQLKSPISNRQSQTAYQSRPQVIEKVKS
ncbi:MAG: hypothetical protein AAFU67_14590, partial [Bacteroidota bacterium]